LAERVAFGRLSAKESSVHQMGEQMLKVEKMAADEEKRCTSFLSIWGDEARKRGIVLPLPFGISGGGMFIWDHAKVTELSLAVGGGSLHPVGILSFDKVDLKDQKYNARLDTWVFPFLNICGILGYTKGEAKTNLTITASQARDHGYERR
jgi:hypothetical protein